MFDFGIQFVDGGLHVHLVVHIVGSDLVGIDLPGLAGLLVRIGLLFLGLIAEFSLTALQCCIIDINLVIVQVHLSIVNLSFVKVDIQVS